MTQQQGPAMIEAQGLTKYFGDFAADMPCCSQNGYHNATSLPLRLRSQGQIKSFFFYLKVAPDTVCVNPRTTEEERNPTVLGRFTPQPSGDINRYEILFLPVP